MNLKHVNCAFRHPTGGVAWDSLLEHQHFCSKCLIINMLTVPSGIRTGGVAWESLLEHQHFCSKSLVVCNKHANCAFRHPPGGVAWEILLEHFSIFCSGSLIYLTCSFGYLPGGVVVIAFWILIWKLFDHCFYFLHVLFLFCFLFVWYCVRWSL